MMCNQGAISIIHSGILCSVVDGWIVYFFIHRFPSFVWSLSHATFRTTHFSFLELFLEGRMCPDTFTRKITENCPNLKTKKKRQDDER